MPSGRRSLQLAAVVLFFIAYSLLSHYSNLNPQARDLAVALALAPMLTLGVVLLWRWNGGPVAVAGAGVAALLLRTSWPTLRRWRYWNGPAWA